MTGRFVLSALLLVVTPLVTPAQDGHPPSVQESTRVDSASATIGGQLQGIEPPASPCTGNDVIAPPEFGVFAPQDDGGLSGRLTAGYGSFATPFFDGWFARSSDDLDFLMKAGYTTSDGHVAHADHRGGHASLSGGLMIPEAAAVFPGARIKGAIGMHGDGYRLFGSREPEQQRTVNRFTAELALHSTLENLFDVSASVLLHGVTMTDRFRSRETSLGFELSLNRDASPVQLTADAGLWLDSYRAPSAGANPFFAHGGVEVSYPLTARVTLRGGLGAVVFRGSDNDRNARLAPSLGVSWYPAGGLTVFTRFVSSVERRTIGVFLEQNPYVTNDLVIRHEERPVFLTGGTEVELAPEMTARAALEYTKVRSYPLYRDEAVEGMWRPEYGGLTRIVALRFDIQAEFGSGHALSSSLVLQGARNSLTGMTPTYFPPVTIGGSYRYRFPFGLTAGGSVKVVARQTTDAAATRTIPAFTLLDLTAAYQILPGLSVNGTVQNLLNPSYSWWEGYRAQPRGVAVSLSHSW